MSVLGTLPFGFLCHACSDPLPVSSILVAIDLGGHAKGKEPSLLLKIHGTVLTSDLRSGVKGRKILPLKPGKIGFEIL